jgi:hypothetical protein
MTHRGHSLNPVRHHNMRVGNHGNVKKRKARAEISRYSVLSPHGFTAHAEPTFLQFIIGLTRHRYRRNPSNLSDLFHHQRR